MSFLFCCGDYKGPVYEIQTLDEEGKIKTETIRNIQDVDPQKLQLASRVIRLEESEYAQLKSQHNQKKKWTDPQFRPGPDSLGEIQNIPRDCQWKRISQILNKPELFDGKVQPKDVIEGSLGSCYFLSAVAALSEVEERIYNIFGQQQFNPAGIYRLKLRVNGVIKEVLIDDYIPVNKAGKPLFCQPNKNQFWVIILEKAWAKINKSYANILTGTPTQVFQTVTYAPSTLKLVKPNEEYMGKLWEEIQYHTSQDRPCCCGAKRKSVMEEMGLEDKGITPGHGYTLLDSANLEDEYHHYHKILKLRDPWGNKEWRGKASQSDKKFWNIIPPSDELQRLQKPSEMGEDGIFFMTYDDFCDYFNDVNFCHLLNKPTYEVETFKPDTKNGNIYKLNVKTADEYIIQLHQNNEKQIKPSKKKIFKEEKKQEPKSELKESKKEIEKKEEEREHHQPSEKNEENPSQRNENINVEVQENIGEEGKNLVESQVKELERQKEEAIHHQPPPVEEPKVQEKKQHNVDEEEPNRLTVLLVNEKNYEFIDGSLKYNESDTSVKARLEPGKYLIFAKVDPHPESNSVPTDLRLSSYSKHFVNIEPVKRDEHPKFFQKVFLQYGKEHKKKEYEDGKMWLSWKLFYEKGGYAFIAFGVDSSCNKKFKVEIDENELNELNFALKKPHKGKGKIELEVMPGQEEIVVCRVMNKEQKKMTFPPPLVIEIEQIDKKYKK